MTKNKPEQKHEQSLPTDWMRIQNEMTRELVKQDSRQLELIGITSATMRSYGRDIYKKIDALNMDVSLLWKAILSVSVGVVALIIAVARLYLR